MRGADLEKFVKDRDAALLSLDAQKIRDCFERYGITLPTGEVFWVTVHKAICEINSADSDQKKTSAEWLTERGYYPGLGTAA